MTAWLKYNYRISDIILCPVFNIKHGELETGSCHRLDVELTQFCPMDRASMCLRNGLLYIKDRTMGNVQNGDGVLL
jgi:hypothetical protein